MKTFLIKFAASFFVLVMLQSNGWAKPDEGSLIRMVQSLQDQMKEVQKTMQIQNETIGVLREENQELRKMISGGTKSAPATVPAHAPSSQLMEDIDFFGDLRLRYEGTSESSGGTSAAATSLDNDRNRFRYRLRFGMEKKFNEEMKVGVRLASGSIGSVGSRNETFDSQFGLKEIGIDWAYASYTPEWAKVGTIKSAEIRAGKFKNPLQDASHKIVWDHDVAPEGIYERVQAGLLDSGSIQTDIDILAGQFVVEEGGGPGTSEDAELFAYRVGFNSVLNEITEKPVKMRNYITVLDYKELTSPGNFGTANGNFLSSGNLAAEDFRILEIYNEIAFQIEGLPPMKSYFEWAKNLSEEAAAGLGGGQDKAWVVGAKVGNAAKKGDWEAIYEYFQIEANSVPGRFNDGEYGHSDSRGSAIKLAYGITDYLKFKAGLYLTNRITADSLTADEERRLLQLDLVWKF